MLVAVTYVVELMFKDLALPPRKMSVFSVRMPVGATMVV